MATTGSLMRSFLHNGLRLEARRLFLHLEARFLSTGEVAVDTERAHRGSNAQRDPLANNSFEPVGTNHRERRGSARILDGRRAAEEWNLELKRAAEEVKRTIGRPPSLSVVLVGERPDSTLYVQRKEETCRKIGIDSEVIRVPESVSQEDLENCVREICSNPAIDGALVQLPLPEHLDEEAIMEAFDPWKDVDGFHALNMGHMLMRGRSPRFVPCTALGCMNLLQSHKIDLTNKTAVVLGDSNIVGTPLSVLLRNRGTAIVTVCHGPSYKKLFEHKEEVDGWRAAAEACNPVLPGPVGRWSVDHAMKELPRTKACEPLDPQTLAQLSQHYHVSELPKITRTADILIVAIGHPQIVKADWVKPGAVVLDIGINVVPKDGWLGEQEGLDETHDDRPFRIVGDVDFKGVSKVASAITPVPGGVGPMTISGVVHNTILAARYGPLTK
ncbi:hypothetical protein BSKO_00518 [Bryopsis sp. KO-2023]|nr:hypothetical protein BSKO_00518 [Bryopsis sp. KO-2023]